MAGYDALGLFLKTGRSLLLKRFQEVNGPGFFWLPDKIHPSVDEGCRNRLNGVTLSQFFSPFGIDVDFLILKGNIVSQGFPEGFCCRTT
jgi:hypothetical protein